jgi:hypothetical protein
MQNQTSLKITKVFLKDRKNGFMVNALLYHEAAFVASSCWCWPSPCVQPGAGNTGTQSIIQHLTVNQSSQTGFFKKIKKHIKLNFHDLEP